MKNNYIPPVIFQEDLTESTQKFISFFYRAPVFTNEIINRFPELKEVVGKDRNEGEPILKEFVRKYFETNSVTIKQFMATVEADFRVNGERALSELTKIMEYEWPETLKGFTVVANIMGATPFDPKKNIIYLSIFSLANTEEAYVKKRLNCTAVIIHEICHLIYHDILKNSSIQPESYAVMHLVQEVLAPVVMNQPGIKAILNINEYWGNPYLKQIIFHTGHGDVNMVEYSSFLYEKTHAEGKTFREYVIRLIEIFISVQAELEQRMGVWNKQGTMAFKEEVSLSKYNEPLSIRE